MSFPYLSPFQSTSTAGTERSVDNTPQTVVEEESSGPPSRSRVRMFATGHTSISKSRRNVSQIDNDGPQASVWVALENTTNALEVEQDRCSKLREEQDDLIRQNNALTQEIRSLKTSLETEDEGVLIRQFHDLHNHIRSWCQRFSETEKHWPVTKFSPLPGTSSNTYHRVENPDKYYVVYSMACLWALLVDQIFQYPLRADKPKDLWTTRSNREAINRLEKSLASADTKDLSQWRCLTVRLLHQLSSSEPREEIDNLSGDVRTISNKIMRIVVRVMGDPKEKEVYQDLEKELTESVMEKAISYSCCLRRQQSHIGVVMPTRQNSSGDYESGQGSPRATPLGITSKPSSREVQIFTRPELLRCSTVTGKALGENVIVVESEKYQIPLKRDKDSPRDAQNI